MTGDTEAPREAPDVVEAAPVLSRAVRRSGRRSTRVLAILSLLAAIGVTAYVISSALEPASPDPLEEATAPAWEATGALSDGLRDLRPGGSRTAAGVLAGTASRDVGAAVDEVADLDLPTSDTPLRTRVLRTLRADARWIDAVQATLDNPRSARRARLADLAEKAALATSVVAEELPDAKDTVGGTGRLLAATRRS